MYNRNYDWINSRFSEKRLPAQAARLQIKSEHMHNLKTNDEWIELDHWAHSKTSEVPSILSQCGALATVTVPYLYVYTVWRRLLRRPRRQEHAKRIIWECTSYKKFKVNHISLKLMLFSKWFWLPAVQSMKRGDDRRPQISLTIKLAGN
jgi:hypothetical protein